MAATGECGLGERRWMAAQRRCGARGGRVDGRPETEWMAARRQRGRRAAQDGCACGDGGVSSRAQNGARGGSVRRPGAHGDGRGGQRSGTRMIFFGGVSRT
jgi:hypothetical protein